MRSLYPSQQYAASKARRLRRIGSRATALLREAFAAGEMTLRQYDLVSRLAPKQQRARIGRRRREIESARIAAETIEAILDRTKGAPGSVQLREITVAICRAVQAAPAKSSNLQPARP
jgi:hypothetical protein